MNKRATSKEQITLGEQVRRLPVGGQFIVHTYTGRSHTKVMREVHSYATRAGIKVQTSKLICVFTDCGDCAPEAFNAVFVVRVW